MNIFYPDSQLIWKNKPVFGLVHSEGCSSCSHYMLHVATAHRTRDASFTQALRDQEINPSSQYLDGMCQGDSLSRGMDIEARQQLAVCQLQLRDALGLAAERQEQLLAVRAELKWLKQQYNDVLDFLDTLESTGFSEPMEFKGAKSEKIQDGPVDLQSVLETPQTPPASVKRQFTALPTPPTTPGREVLEHDPSPVEVSSITSKPTTASPGSGVSVPLVAKVDPSPLKDATNALKKDVPQKVVTYPPTPSPEPLKLTLPSPEVEKPAPAAVQTVALVPPLSTKKPTYEIFVDSSGWGIGFVLNGRWLAWPLKGGWNTDGRDNNWAEMVAVELGLRILISAGVHTKTILIRSDNTGVVQALKTGRTKHVQQKAVLSTIFDLCNGSEIGISVTWVDTKNNKADGPSRGQFGSKSLLFPTQLEVPPHFAEFLAPRVS